jgi:flagellar hook-basal body complex protein FliE
MKKKCIVVKIKCENITNKAGEQRSKDFGSALQAELSAIWQAQRKARRSLDSLCICSQVAIEEVTDQTMAAKPAPNPFTSNDHLM